MTEVHDKPWTMVHGTLCKNVSRFSYRIGRFFRYFYWIKSFISSNASCMSSTSSCIPLSAILKSFKSLKWNWSPSRWIKSFFQDQQTSKIKNRKLKTVTKSLLVWEYLKCLKKILIPDLEFLRPLQLDHLINFKKVLHDDYIKIISYPVKYHLR